MERLKLRIEQLMEDLESDTKNHHMNDLEYGRYTALQEVIEIIDELKD